MQPDPPPSSEDRTQPPEAPRGRAADPGTLPRPAEAPTAASAPAGFGDPFGKLPATFGRYRLLKLLGRGGMGAVYLAHDAQLDRRVALKVPRFAPGDDPRVMERFFREARAAATVHHPNICLVYDVGESGGTHYLTMAYIEGRPLSALTGAGRKPLAPRQVAALVRKLALALAEAHRHGVIHRDLKPANIMLTARGEPVIMDFGLARRGKPTDARLTQEGLVLGTPAYMAPEQARGNPDDMGPGCDIYGLGVILYELLAGRPPFVGEIMAILTQALMDEPTPPSAHRPGIDPVLEAICLKALAKEPASRQRSMAELAAALTDYLKAGGSKAAETESPVTAALAEPEPERPQPSRTRRRRPPPKRLPWGLAALAGSVAAVLLVGLGAVASLTWHRAQLPQAPASADERTRAPREAPSPQAAAPQPVAPPPAPAPPPPGPAPPPPVGDVGYAWPPELLRGGKVPTPDLRLVAPWFVDRFADPRSGFPHGKFDGGERGYRDGLYFIQLTAPGVQRVRIPLDRATPPNPPGAFVCEVVGRALGPGGWALACFDGPEADARVHFGVRVMHGGRLKVIRNNLGDAETTELSDTAVVSHDAIKKGGDPYNALQLLVRHRDLEVYVNGVAVCDPVLLDREVAAPYLALVAWGGGRRPLTVEYQRVTVWPAESIPPLDQRGAVPKGR